MSSHADRKRRDRPGHNRRDGQLDHGRADIRDRTPDHNDSDRPVRKLEPQYHEQLAAGLRLLRGTRRARMR